ncbi:MAG: GNAT family N-acetyltransferase [bacterium]|nr:GNAT family N-acetyltransferase [bacterium]
MLKTEIVNIYVEDIVNDIAAINQGSFPPGWKYGEDKAYYRKMLKSGKNVIVLLKNNGKNIGFLLAIPHNEAVTELKDDDRLMTKDPARYYIETIAILPEYRGKNGFSVIIKALGQELSRRGFYNISLHARVANNFSNIVQKKVRVTKIRRVDKWKYCNNEEPVDYIEGTLTPQYKG